MMSEFKIKIRQETISAKHLTLIAGPCAIESKDILFGIAERLSQIGIRFMRAGAFKPRTSPKDFQGLGVPGLALLREVSEKFNLITVSEIMSIEHLAMASETIDIIQIGARNMQNFDLLKAVGKMRQPVILKRGLSATYKEWLSAAEYILEGGNEQVILCERGIRTFESHTRNTLDLNAIPVLKSLTHLPIIVDPSHGTGLRELVPAMAKAAIAAGADGVMIEAHTTPEEAISDARQTINIETLEQLAPQLRVLHELIHC